MLNLLADTSSFLGTGLGIAGAAIGCGLVIVGAGVGIGLIGAGSVQSLARQPEVGNRIFTFMLISSALIEGMAFFSIIVCLLGMNKIESMLEMVTQLPH